MYALSPLALGPPLCRMLAWLHRQTLLVYDVLTSLMWLHMLLPTVRDVVVCSFL